MIVSIHQPNYIPWIGYFDKINRSDIHVFLDDVKYAKNGFINRNKILMNSSETYLTIPISKKDHNSHISNIVVGDPRWKTKHIKTLHQAYSKTKYMKEYMPSLEEIITKNNSLCSLNSEIIMWMCKEFGLNTQFSFSSHLNKNSKLTKTSRLVDICQTLGAKTYLSGTGARDYLQLEEFADIDVVWQSFIHPHYQQNSGMFVENMSALDLLFNEGPLSQRFFIQ
jgi:hypothetical protein